MRCSAADTVEGTDTPGRRWPWARVQRASRPAPRLSLSRVTREACNKTLQPGVLLCFRRSSRLELRFWTLVGVSQALGFIQTPTSSYLPVHCRRPGLTARKHTCIALRPPSFEEGGAEAGSAPGSAGEGHALGKMHGLTLGVCQQDQPFEPNHSCNDGKGRRTSPLQFGGRELPAETGGAGPPGNPRFEEHTLELLQRSLGIEQLIHRQTATAARGFEPAGAGDPSIAHEGWSDRASNLTGWRPKVGTVNPAHK